MYLETLLWMIFLFSNEHHRWPTLKLCSATPATNSQACYHITFPPSTSHQGQTFCLYHHWLHLLHSMATLHLSNKGYLSTAIIIITCTTSALLMLLHLATVVTIFATQLSPSTCCCCIHNTPFMFYCQCHHCYISKLRSSRTCTSVLHLFLMRSTFIHYYLS